MHNGLVVAYTSRQLKSHKENYPIRYLDLASIIFELKVWQRYLYCIPFEMFNDHKSLKYLFDKKELNMCQRKWMKHLKDYEFDFKYHPRKANKVAYDLSRKEIHADELLMLEYDMVKKFQNLDLQFTWTHVGALISNLSITCDIRERVLQT